MYEKSLENPYSREIFSIQDTVQDRCGWGGSKSMDLMLIKKVRPQMGLIFFHKFQGIFTESGWQVMMLLSSSIAYCMNLLILIVLSDDSAHLT